jgi:hypothetical protein
VIQTLSTLQTLLLGIKMASNSNGELLWVLCVLSVGVFIFRTVLVAVTILSNAFTGYCPPELKKDA